MTETKYPTRLRLQLPLMSSRTTGQGPAKLLQLSFYRLGTSCAIKRRIVAQTTKLYQPDCEFLMNLGFMVMF